MKELIRSKQKKQGAVKLAGALGLLLALFLIFGLVATPAMAVPQLPHRFFGEVKIQPCDIFAPEDAQVSAEIYDPGLGQWVKYTSTSVVLVDDIAWYDFNVPPDDDETPAKDGGDPGDEIRFYVGGVLAGIWGDDPWEPGFENGGSDRFDLEVTDDIDPSGTIIINGGDACTNSRNVTLDLDWSDAFPSCGVVSMHFSNDNATWSAWEAVAATKAWTLTAGDEVKTVYVEFLDNAGAGNNSNSWGIDISDVITLDTTDPVVVITAPADEGCYTTADTPALAYDVTEVNTYTVDEEGYSTLEGEHAVTVTATDCAGNVGSDSVTYIVNNTNPVITITGVSDGVCYNTDVTPVITITDAHLTSSSITLNGEVFVSGTTITEDGTYTLIATAEDCAGNTTVATVDFTIDTIDPVVVITAPADEGCYTTADTPALAYDVTEVNIDTVVEDGYSTAEGEHTVTVTVTDCAGNVGSDSVTYIVNNTNPVITITGVSDGVVYNTDVTPVITITDAHLTSSSITLNGEVFVSGTTITEDGTYTLIATAEDCAGNTTEVTVGFTITTTALLINEFVSAPGVGEEVEWIELFNPGAEEIDLTGWTIENGTSSDALDGLVPASGYLVLQQATDFTFVLGDAGDTIILTDDTETEVDRVAYGDYDDGNTADNAPAPGEDESTGRCPNGSDTDVDNVDFIVFTTPTPGAANLAEPAVTTQAATNILDVSATLNGSLDDLGCPPGVDVSFKWGLVSGDLDQETPLQAMGATGDFNAEIDGLTPNTTYYFQAKADSVTGAELSFTTLEIPPPMFIELADGWNTFSVPLSLDPDNNTLGDLATLGGLDIDIAWYLYNDGVTTAWVQALPDYVMLPCDAIYVNMNAAGTVPIYPNPSVSVSAKDVYTGWNLVGSAFINETGEMAVDESLISLYYVEGELMPWGYSQVISPGLNQPGWTYPRDGTVVYNMLIGKGYLVAMENDDIYTGWTSTPWSP